jgi:predicted DNA-binding protein
LLRKKADWAHSSNDLQLAADMLVASGDYDKAIKIMINNDWIDKLVRFSNPISFTFRVLQLANRLDRSDANLIREIGKYLESKEEYTVAAGLYTQIGDIRSIALMHAIAEHWDDVSEFLEWILINFSGVRNC